MNDLVLLAQSSTEGEAAPSGSQEATPAQPAVVETATKTEAPGENGQQDVPPKKPGLSDMMLPLILMFVVIYFVMFRGQKKKQKQHKDMLTNLKKNARVRTIGGIIGTVIDVRDDEVVIKIDEANNSKIRLIRSAISTVLDDDKDGK